MLKQFLDRLWTGGTSDSDLYAIVAQEIASGDLDVGLWTKANATSDGAKEKAEARYIEMRVSVLRRMRPAMERQRQAAHVALLAAQSYQREMEKRNTVAFREKERQKTPEYIRQKIYDLYESPGAMLRRRRRRLITATFPIATMVIIDVVIARSDGNPSQSFSGWVLLNSIMAIFFFSIWLAITSEKFGRLSALRADLDVLQKQRAGLK